VTKKLRDNPTVSTFGRGLTRVVVRRKTAAKKAATTAQDHQAQADEGLTRPYRPARASRIGSRLDRARIA
jgi:hypothetical protein